MPLDDIGPLLDGVCVPGVLLVNAPGGVESAWACRRTGRVDHVAGGRVARGMLGVLVGSSTCSPGVERRRRVVARPAALGTRARRQNGDVEVVPRGAVAHRAASCGLGLGSYHPSVRIGLPHSDAAAFTASLEGHLLEDLQGRCPASS